MKSHQLESLLHDLLGDMFCGVWASDQLHYLTRSFQPPAYFIVNTHPAHLPGEHWLALTLEKEDTATFFDSFGFSPDHAFYPPEILAFLRHRSKRILFPTKQLQHPLSFACGHHCVFYLYQRAKGLSLEQIFNLYSDGEEGTENDDLVMEFVRSYQHCIRNHSCGSSQDGACSLQMFRDCCDVLKKKEKKKKLTTMNH